MQFPLLRPGERVQKGQPIGERLRRPASHEGREAAGLGTAVDLRSHCADPLLRLGELGLQRSDGGLELGLLGQILLVLLVHLVVVLDEWLGLLPDLSDLGLDLGDRGVGARLRSGHHHEGEGGDRTRGHRRPPTAIPRPECEVGSLHSGGYHACPTPSSHTADRVSSWLRAVAKADRRLTGYCRGFTALNSLSPGSLWTTADFSTAE